MASLTPAALVAQLEDAMRSGSVPPVGKQVGIEEWLPPMAAGIALHAAPDLVCVMVGAPGVENRYHGVDGIFAGWEDWGESFETLDLIIEEIAEVPVGALVRVRQHAVTRRDACLCNSAAPCCCGSATAASARSSSTSTARPRSVRPPVRAGFRPAGPPRACLRAR